MATPISIYGINFSESELKERAKWHRTTWIEQEIPEAIFQEVADIIEQKVTEFENKCGCGLCKLNNTEPVIINENLK